MCGTCVEGAGAGGRLKSRNSATQAVNFDWEIVQPTPSFLNPEAKTIKPTPETLNPKSLTANLKPGSGFLFKLGLLRFRSRQDTLRYTEGQYM